MVTGMQKNHVTVNGLVAKPSKEVFPTDKVTLEKTKSHKSVLDIPESRVGLKLVDMYRRMILQSRSNIWIEIIETTLSKKWYRKTYKKDRRDIDEFGNEKNEDEKTISFEAITLKNLTLN
jgi:ribosome-associated heat shock protein Hsp15